MALQPCEGELTTSWGGPGRSSQHWKVLPDIVFKAGSSCLFVCFELESILLKLQVILLSQLPEKQALQEHTTMPMDLNYPLKVRIMFIVQYL
jgi:hypothetical protein